MFTSGGWKVRQQEAFVEIVQVWVSEDSLQCCRHWLHCKAGRQGWRLWLWRFSQDLLSCNLNYCIQVLFQSHKIYWHLQYCPQLTLTLFSRCVGTYLCMYVHAAVIFCLTLPQYMFIVHIISSFLKIYWLHHIYMYSFTNIELPANLSFFLLALAFLPFSIFFVPPYKCKLHILLSNICIVHILLSNICMYTSGGEVQRLILWGAIKLFSVDRPQSPF